MIKIYYHSADLDGHCAGAIVKYKFPDAELCGINYGQEIDYNNISKDDIIYMVDFSLQPFTKMVQLAAHIGMNNLIWIDHHISTIKEAESVMLVSKGIEITFNNVCPGKRQDGKAGCELTWEVLFPDREIPEAVRLLGRYDVWDLQPNVLRFQYGFRLNDSNPDNQALWIDYFEDFCEENCTGIMEQTINDGETIIRYQKQENEKYVKSCAFEVLFEGYKAIACNKMLNNSQFFESIWDNTKYDIMISFGLHKNGFWTFSFYTDKPGVDVSLLAKKLGGGGHKQASGCQFDELPIEFTRQVQKLQPVKLEDISEYGDKMTISEFIEAAYEGAFSDDDGIGYYATEDKMTRIVASPSSLSMGIFDDRWSHVVWFNK